MSRTVCGLLNGARISCGRGKNKNGNTIKQIPPKICNSITLVLIARCDEAK